MSERAQARLIAGEGRPMFLADWVEVVFMHYQVDPRKLQRAVPFALDLAGGRAFVSLVAFTSKRMRLRVGGRVGDWVCRPIAEHGFFNVRTYVRHQGEAGIYFIAEWLPNALARLLGPRTYGLPYRDGDLDYHNDGADGAMHGTVTARDTCEGSGGPGVLRYRCTDLRHKPLSLCRPGTLSEFLLERYTAYTHHRGIARRFRVWHSPWRQRSVAARVDNRALLERCGSWSHGARLIGAHHSPGVHDVWIGKPACVNGPACAVTWDDHATPHTQGESR